MSPPQKVQTVHQVHLLFQFCFVTFFLGRSFSLHSFSSRLCSSSSSFSFWVSCSISRWHFSFWSKNRVTLFYCSLLSNGTLAWLPEPTCSCCSSRMLASHWSCRSLIWFSCFCCWCSRSFFCLFSSWAANWRRDYWLKAGILWGNVSLSELKAAAHLFDLLPLLLGADDGSGDAEALLEHGHAGFGFAALDLGQSGFLLRLLVLHLLDQTLVVALHLLHLLYGRRETHSWGFSFR